jgi:hypothetical protein
MMRKNKNICQGVVLLCAIVLAACTNRTPGMNPKCKSIAYPEDKHTVCNSFEYYGNKTWTLDSAFYNGQDITDSVMEMVGGYYRITFGSASYSVQKQGYLNYGYVELGLGYRWSMLNFPSLMHEKELFTTIAEMPPEPYLSSKYLAPLPMLHTFSQPLCKVDSVSKWWEIQSLTKSRIKVLHHHRDSVFIAIFKTN